MRLSLSTTSIRIKLFYAIFSMAVVVILAMGIVARLSFTHDFLGYLNEQTENRMDMLIPQLEAAYRGHGSWDFIRNNRPAWFALMRAAANTSDNASQIANTIDNKPPALGSNSTAPDLTGAHLRFTLLDADRKFVIGFQNVASNALLRPIMCDSVIVGWVAMTPFQNVIAAIDQRFQENQMIANLVIGLVSILLASFIAIKIARVMLAPLTRLTQATHRLASGDYTSRVVVTSQDEIGQLAVDFNQLAHTLERNEQMRRDFMADVSHELRTPLGILHGQLEAIEDGLLDTGIGTIKSLQAEVATLNKLVSNLYDLSLADVGALTYRKVDIDIGQLLRSSVQTYETIYRTHELTISYDLPQQPILVHADKGRLQQLFNNIFENTLRYTNSGGRLHIRCRLQHQCWLLQFDDTAPGATAAALPYLFDRFFREDASRNRASGGAGLGLAICQRIVEAHDGTISATASTIGGLCLEISLPVSQNHDY